MNEVKGVPNFSLVELTPHLFTSTLRLFNAVPIKTKKTKVVPKEIIALTLNHGFILSPEVYANFSVPELESIIELASNEIGLTPEQMNSSFHKSWKKVRDAPIFQLVLEQLCHYITTYGYERLGIYDKNSVYIPNEALEIPGLKSDLRLAVINGYTKKQLKDKLLTILDSGIALKSLTEVVNVSEFCELKQPEIEGIKNKEVRIRLYDKLNIAPTNPTEFLRLLIFKTTGDSLLIVNKKTIDAIKESDELVKHLFAQYDNAVGYRRLAEIFLRFKPLFLAFRDHENMSPIINKISHLSHIYHKPMPQDMLNNITGLLKNHAVINTTHLKRELKDANIFRKIRLAYALNFRTTDSTGILYKVRNGKSFVKELDFDNIDGARRIYDIVMKSITTDLKHLKGQKFYIPENVKYALPATEKQFTGQFPSGSSIRVPKNMVFGVHWDNVKGNRIDLDLSIISLQHGKIGWDASYRSSDSNILFSGDVTDASRGASELFYVARNTEDTLLLNINYFNYNESVPVPFKILVAEERPRNFGNNYTVDPNNVRCVSKTVIAEKQKVLGLIKVREDDCEFYFSETALGNSITSRDDDRNELASNYLENYTTNMPTLNDVLVKAGAKLVDELDEDVTDLSPEVIEKDTFISLLTDN